MFKRIIVCLLSLFFLMGAAIAEEQIVSVTLPQSTDRVTNYVLQEAWSAEKNGYSTVGWLVEAESENAFHTFIDQYRDSLLTQGFTLSKEVRPSNLNAVYYFFDHPDERLSAAKLNGIAFDLYLCSEVSGNKMAMLMGVVPGITLTEPAPQEEIWDSLFAPEEPLWESVLEALNTGHKIPSFASFAEAAILSKTENNGRSVYTLSLENASAFMQYAELLEAYGLSGMDGSEEKYGLPMYSWFEDCEWEMEPQREMVTLTSGDEAHMDGYVFFSLDLKDDALAMTVWYAEGINAIDTGERWDGAALDEEITLELKRSFTLAQALSSAYSFKNADIAADIAFKLGKEINQITLSDIQDYYGELGVIMTSNTDLSDVKNMPQISAFLFSPTDGVYDLSCLENCSNLRRIALNGGSYENLDVLASQSRLSEVELKSSSISDISWLQDKKNVAFVSISGCNVTDFSALASLPELKQVYLEISLKDDVSFLYGKELTFGPTFGSPTTTFDTWYEYNWGTPDAPAAEEADDVQDDVPNEPQNAPANSNDGQRCSTCGGDGYQDVSCSRCGGDGKTDTNCSSCFGDGKRDCMSCAGKGYDNCSGCYGSGRRRCGSCSGTGKNGSRSCTSCGGTGNKTCSSCSGSGKRRCSACSGSGDRSCTSCGGDGRKDQSCTSCGGDGRDTRLCTSCGGDGKR